jgi:hypothetical protein
VESNNYYAVLSPTLKASRIYDAKTTPVEEGFRFSSDNNKFWHTEETFLATLRESGILK